MKTQDIYEKWNATGKLRRKDIAQVLLELYVIHRARSGHPGALARPLPPEPLITFPVKLFEMIASYATGKKNPFASYLIEQSTAKANNEARWIEKARELYLNGKAKTSKQSLENHLQQQGREEAQGQQEGEQGSECR